MVGFATLSYTLRFTSGKPPKDLLYKWSTVAGTLFQFAIIAAIIYGIAGLSRDRRGVFALRRPTSWRTAIKIGIGVGIGIFVLSLILTPLLEPGREPHDGRLILHRRDGSASGAGQRDARRTGSR